MILGNANYGCSLEKRSGIKEIVDWKLDVPMKVHVQDLLWGIRNKRDELYRQGIKDGTGMAYTLTSEYQELEKLLTDEQLFIVDMFYGPPAYAIPSR